MQRISPEVIKIDYERDCLLDDFSHATLSDRYLIPKENSAQQAFARAAAAYADDDAHAQRIYNYVSKGWFMYSTPILANGGTKRGQPISCFLNSVPDSREGILAHYTENGWLSSMGGGIGSYWGGVRSNGTVTSKGSRTSGIIPFIKMSDSEVLAFKQGDQRRGSAAVYLDISHPEIVEFLSIRKATGGDPKRKCGDIHHGVNIPDAFMDTVTRDGDWDLIDPHTHSVTGTTKARTLWREIITTRAQHGEPYLHFIDASNRALPEAQKKLGLRVRQSNLCTEILLPTGEDHLGKQRTAVCCLSSVNIAKYGEWKTDTKFIEDLLRLLDNVLTSFIKNAPEAMENAKYSAMRERAVGLGAFGWHTYLQQNMIPFAAMQARSINVAIFKHIQAKSIEANLKLGSERGEAPDMVGTGKRFSHTNAIAPNATSSIICGGVSPSCDPIPANTFLHKTLSGSFEVKNKKLEELLEEKGHNTYDVWRSILSQEGSVQHLDCLSEFEKDVFKTSMEIDQMAVIKLAADRTPFIDQGQSMNLHIRRGMSVEELSRIHFAGWALGVKTFYYCRSVTLKRGGIQSKIETRRTVEVDLQSDCVACEG